MKFQIVQCPHCGNMFNKTNPRKTYCKGSCRVAAHRERHGLNMPFFDTIQMNLLKEIIQSDISEWHLLFRDANRYRIIESLYDWADSDKNEEEKDLLLNVIMKVLDEEYEDVRSISEATLRTIKFTKSLEKLISYSKEKRVLKTCEN